MKNIVKKIKHWLIRKLGGYTEQFSYESKPIEVIHKTYDFWPMVLARKIKIDLFDLNKIDEIIESVKHDMLYTVGERLNSNGFVKWQIVDNLEPDTFDGRCIEIRCKILAGKQ